MPKQKTSQRSQIDSIRHKDRRVNIPTEELRDFVAEEERTPKKLLYPRDPTLDPQLVWKGKDEQDSQNLAVDLVPVYIQEKIHPHAIIEDLRAQAAAGRPGDQPSLFAEFNGIPFEQQIEFYQHEQNWANRLILGDSLLVMASLAEKEGLKGKVQMIYLDPPYGIDFKSNWQVKTGDRDVRDGKIEHLTRQPEQIRAFRDTWELGIHSYLSYLRDRLAVARELLTDTGSVFVQIGNQNVHLVRCLLDEVFDGANFVEHIAFRTKNMTLGGVLLEGVCDYLLWYAKDKPSARFRRLYEETRAEGDAHWNRYVLPDGTSKSMTAEQVANHALLPPQSDVYQLASLYPAGPFATGVYDFDFQGKTYSPPPGRSWKSPIQGMKRLAAAARIEPYADGDTIRYVLKLKDYPVSPIHNVWLATPPPSEKVYAVQTSVRVIERCLLMTTDPGDLVLDPTCGSGTTACVAEQWGRRWITIDTSRVALALARTRLMAAKFPYYLLADSPEGLQKEAEISGIPPAPSVKTHHDVKKGFVYKRVPHVTLKSIANNEEINTIYARFEDQLEPLRARLNQLLGHKWEEWEVPREPGTNWPAQAVKALEEWWRLRRQRQKEIDASIARRAETEFLYNEPYDDPKRIRVSGPFTVESLSPHRVLSTDQERPATEVEGEKSDTAGQFVNVILENLRKAGVENRIKNERLMFDRLESYAGVCIQATGEYTDAARKRRRVAVSVGPQYGTVGPELVKEAAKEAVQGVGFDLLVVCGFAFDPHVPEEARRYGKLTVLPAKMNPDLLMGDELLKKTRAGNLFMVFGEPDIELRKIREGKLQVEIRGVDVYDPTTQEIRSDSTEDIACWFLDTNYNGESFFVRHAYFTGADEPYDKLKRALRAEIDEGTWSALYSTISRPFDPPATGKIAVKVINHYGDEILKVFTVPS